jgi:inosine/xanthosine triphosphate pyrophosphatase family protein
MTYGALERRGTKGSFSHRAIALGKFAEWYINNSV